MIDLIFLAIFLIACWAGARKGVFGAAAGLCGSLISYLGAVKIIGPALTPMIAGILEPSVEKMLLQAAGDRLSQVIQGPAAALGAQLDSLMQSLRIPEHLFDAVRQNLQISGQDLLSAAAKAVSQEIAPVLAFLAGFALCKGVVWLLVYLAGSKLPVVRAVNHGAGLALGAAGGLLMILLLCLGMRALAPQGVGGFLDQQSLAQSHIGAFVYGLFPGTGG